MTEKTRKMLQELVSDLAHLYAKRRDIQEMIGAEGSETLEQIASINKIIGDAQLDIEMLQMSLKEKFPDLYEDMDELDSEIKAREAGTKKVVHALPAQETTKTQKIYAEGLELTVSSVRLQVDWKCEELILTHPQLLEAELGGDPLIKRYVDEAVMERLIAIKEVDGAKLEEFKINSRPRSPQVRFKETEA
jgi:hypothetical protein